MWSGLNASGELALLPLPKGEGWGEGLRSIDGLPTPSPQPSPQPRSGLPDFGQSKVPNSGKPEVRVGEGAHRVRGANGLQAQTNMFCFQLTRVTRIFQKSVLTKIASAGTGGTWLPASLLPARGRRRAGVPNATLRCSQRPPARLPCFRIVINNGWHNSRACRRPSRLGAQR